MMQQPGMVPPPMVPAPDQQHYQQPPQQYGQQMPQQQQQWMMAPPQPQVPQQQQQMWGQQPQQYQQQGAAGAGQPMSPDEVRTLWIGDLQPWMDEMYVRNCFAHTNELTNVKVIRNKQTQQSERYGFVEFVSHAAAERILQTYNGTMMPNVEQTFRLNWASHGGGEKRQDATPDHTIFVGDLAPDVTDYMLQETFKAHYHSVKGAKVVMDRLTGRSKGYGFVRFSDEGEQMRAMTEMNSYVLSNRAMRTGPAANKKTTGATDSYPNTQGGGQSDSDPTNTTIFVGNLDASVTDEHLRQVFSPYGSLVHVKIPVGKRCGFVQYVDRSCAEAALQALNGTQLGGQNVRLSWGRSPSNRQDSSVGAAQPQWGGAGYYGYPQGYDAYGYGAAAAAQDPNMYYGGYPAYGNYGVPQQQQPVQQQ